ncbi:MAG: 2-C-methyl-D-erythritol 4-phosphate cytidylyltransferase 1 [Tenericutes bacterium ADurb.BinA155]|jgi:2-C-methyl-D-erythritol 4-phosphate cytidylyltransferase|nr:MAG: 2-C-methyl-D-erythritol 4-phosphate cytidylyltransferase 1 [Tenericutes bacterium ADurb.BinA155]
MKLPTPQHIAIVLLGGLGTRFASRLPKQFTLAGEKPLMCYALKAVNDSPDIDDVIVVTAAAFGKATQDVISDYRFRKVSAVIDGGTEREDSVWNALCYLKDRGIEDNDIVLICDGDRPNLTGDLIKANLDTATHYGAAVTAIPSTDSVIYSEDGLKAGEYLPRKLVYLAQTPQTFQFDLIFKAHQKARKKPKLVFTDDASIACYSKKKPAIVLGSTANIKITTKQDVALFLAGRKK